MSDERRNRVAESAFALIANLEDYVREESEEEDAQAGMPATPGKSTDKSENESTPIELPDGSGQVVVSVGGRGELDDAAAAMISQVLNAQGAAAHSIDHQAVAPGNVRSLSLEDLHTLIVVFLNPLSLQHAKYLVRRVKRKRPGLRVGVLLWKQEDGAASDRAPSLSESDIGCDFLAHSIVDAVVNALLDQPVKTAKTAKAAKVA